jgi:hypothetical protein
MNAWTVSVEMGTRLAHDGELWTVVAMEADCVVLAGPRRARKRVVTATLLADVTTRVLGGHEAVPSPMGSLLDDLSDAEGAQLSERLGHVREVLTGYRSGSADLTEPGEPRAGYDSSTPLMERYRVKAAELGVGSRTVERWAAALREWGRSVFSTEEAHARPTRLPGWTPAGWRCAARCWRSTPTPRARPSS